MSWETLLSGLIGALVGGLATFVSSWWSTKRQVKIQVELFEASQRINEDHNKRNLSKYCALAKKDIISSVIEIIKISNGNITAIIIGEDYDRLKIELQDILSIDDFSAMHKLYANFKRIGQWIESEENLSREVVKRKALEFCKELYGENLKSTIIQTGNGFESKDILIDNLNYKYKDLIKTLDQHSKINQV